MESRTENSVPVNSTNEALMTVAVKPGQLESGATDAQQKVSKIADELGRTGESGAAKITAIKEEDTSSQELTYPEGNSEQQKSENDADDKSGVKKTKTKKKPEISQKMLVRIVTDTPRGSLWKLYTSKRGEAVDTYGSQAVIDDCILMPIMSPPTGQKEFIKPQDLQNFFVFLRLLLDSQNAKNKLSFCLNCFAFKQFTYRTTYLSISLAWIFPSFQKHCKYQTLPNTTSTDPTASVNPSIVLAKLADDWDAFLHRFSILFSHHGFIKPSQVSATGSSTSTAKTPMSSFLSRSLTFQIPSYFNKCISVHRMHKPDLCGTFYKQRNIPNPLVLYPEYEGELEAEAREAIAKGKITDGEWKEWLLKREKMAKEGTEAVSDPAKEEDQLQKDWGEVPPIEPPFGCDSESEGSGHNHGDSDDSSCEGADRSKGKGKGKSFTFGSAKKKKKGTKCGTEKELPSFVRGNTSPEFRNDKSGCLKFKGKKDSSVDSKKKKSEADESGMASSSSANKHSKKSGESDSLGKRKLDNSSAQVTVPLTKFTKGPSISDVSAAISQTLGL